ncbi:MAG: CHAD domain-containing protein [Deltaproteobacteria bacterium]|nr:CHAD domain-containing protein [Deltaproteobacteria bacterium]
MHEELELKLRCTAGFEPAVALAWLRQHGELVARGERRHLDLYLDTPDGRLQAAGLSARRRGGPSGVAEVQVKPVPLAPGLVMRRAEVVAELDRGRDAGSVLRHTLEVELGLRVPDTLRSVVELDARRDRWILNADDYQAELSFDRVRGRRPGETRHHDFVELELELVQGSAASFEAMATAMAAALTSRGRAKVATTSKLLHARKKLGYPAFFAEIPLPTLHGRMRVGTAARDLGRALMMRLRQYEPGTRVGLDPEQLHQMRTAVGRLRALLQLFRGAFERATRKALREELRWVAEVLAQLDTIQSHREALPRWRRWLDTPAVDTADGWDALDQALAAAHARARKALREVLDSSRYRRLSALADASFAASEEGSTAAGRVRLEDALPDLLRRPLRRLSKATGLSSTAAGGQWVPAVHAEVRALGHVLELLTPLATKRKSMRRHIDTLAAMQRELGAIDGDRFATAVSEILQPSEADDAGRWFVLGLVQGASTVQAKQAAATLARADWRGRAKKLREGVPRVLLGR